jgi:hypothetical protein
MTPLEDKVRKAFQAKADQVPADVVPSLRLPARRRRFFSLTYGGGQSMGAPTRRGWLAPVACAVLVVAMIAGSVAISRIMLEHQRRAYRHDAVATSNRAAAWVAAQVSRSAVVSCDLVICRALRAHGFPAHGLLVLQPGGASPLQSQVIVATATVRREFGSRLSSMFAPVVIASFGSGNARIDVRVIAPNGAAGYLSRLRADVQARKANAPALLDTGGISASAIARRQLAAGQVDPRLMILISFLAPMSKVDIAAFGDSGPGATAGVPLRSVSLAGSIPRLQSILAHLSQTRAPYRPEHTELTRASGQRVLVIEYDAPSPLGLFAAS